MFEHRGYRFFSVRKVVGMLVLGTMFVVGIGFGVMLLWNGLLPGIFGLKAITYWQAMGLLLLARILFGGFHHRHGSHLQHRRRMLQRWDRMSPEEREKFRQGFRRCFRDDPETGKV